MKYGLGVDLGTTYTAAAVRINGDVEPVELGSRRPEIPSVVLVAADGTVLIGEAAERRGVSEPARLAREFKRRIGDPVPILVGGTPYSAHALLAKLLAEVHANVTRLREGPPDWVTVTHPANWGPYKRELLDQAVHLADLRTVTFRSEPEAAAVQYAAGERVGPGELVVVYDLGGGTFDAAVLHQTATGFSLLGEPEGIEQLGGIDFDEAVFGFVVATLGDAVGRLDPEDEAATAALTRLRRDCTEAKEALSYDTETTIPVALPGLHTRVRLNRSEFESMIAPTLAETVAALHRALRSADVAPADLHSILLVGGSSRIPLVRQLLEAEFGRPVVRDPHPEQAIALGAARVAGVVIPASGPPLPGRSIALPPDPSQGPQQGPPGGWLPPVTPGPTTPRDTQVVFGVGRAAMGAPPPGEPVTQGMPAVQGAPVVQGMPDTRDMPAMPEAWPGGPRPGRPRRVGRRALLIGVPAVLALAGAGTAAALVAGEDDPPPDQRGSGASPDPTAGPTPSATPGDPAPFPTDPLLIQVVIPGGGGSTRTEIFRRDPRGRNPKLVAGSGGDTLPQWSHDRSALAYLRRRGKVLQIVRVGADGNDRTVLVDGLERETRLSWSPDDRSIAYIALTDGKIQVFTVAVDPLAPQRVTRSAEPKWDAAWAPHDPNLMLMSALRNGKREIISFRLDAPDASRTVLTSVPAGANAIDPCWSPDGKRIAYALLTTDGPAGVRTMNADGSDDRSVTESARGDTNPTWSPGGGWIAFARNGNPPAVYVVRADGSDLRKITAGSAREVYACWS